MSFSSEFSVVPSPIAYSPWPVTGSRLSDRGVAGIAADPASIQQAVNFALSLDVTGLCTAGDPKVLPVMLRACQEFQPMDVAQRQALIDTAGQFEPLFA